MRLRLEWGISVSWAGVGKCRSLGSLRCAPVSRDDRKGVGFAVSVFHPGRDKNCRLNWASQILRFPHLFEMRSSAPIFVGERTPAPETNTGPSTLSARCGGLRSLRRKSWQAKEMQVPRLVRCADSLGMAADGGVSSSLGGRAISPSTLVMTAGLNLMELWWAIKPIRTRDDRRVAEREMRTAPGGA